MRYDRLSPKLNYNKQFSTAVSSLIPVMSLRGRGMGFGFPYGETDFSLFFEHPDRF